MKYIYLITILTISGCAMLQPLTDFAAASTAKSIEQYCKNISEINREIYRKQVNDLLKHQYLIINCGKETYYAEATQVKQKIEQENISEIIWFQQKK